jgi:hypothetical protein
MSARARVGAVVGVVAVLGLVFITAGPGSGGGDEKALAAKILKIADLIEKGDATGGTAQAKALAKNTELEDVMHLFRPRKKKGIGVGEKAGAINPDGIEQQLLALGRDEPSKAMVTKDAKALQRVGYVAAAIGEFALAKPPEKDMGEKKVSKWLQWSKDMREAAVGFADSVKTNSPAAIHKAAMKLNDSCNNCHTVFRE